MKKVFLSLAAVAVLSVVSCKKADAAAETTEEVVVDSTVIVVDSADVAVDTAVIVTDSVVAE